MVHSATLQSVFGRCHRHYRCLGRSLLGAAILLLVVGCQEPSAPDISDDPAAHVRYWAEMGAPLSQLQLAKMYEQGFHVAADPRQAVFWFRRAARAGLVDAQQRLARALTLGELSLEPDSNRAAFWWQQVAMSGESGSLIDWAYVHFHGEAGFKRNCQLAVQVLDGPSEDSDDNELLNALAWILSTCPDRDGRDGPRAVALMEMVMSNHGDLEPAYVDTLAAAYAEAGDFRRAVDYQQVALELLPIDSHPEELADYELRLQLYREGEPYRIDAGGPVDSPLEGTQTSDVAEHASGFQDSANDAPTSDSGR